jgi:hypothetical protein
MLAVQAALWGSTGNPATSVFQTLSAGNTEQLGAPGSGDPAEAVPGAATNATPSQAIVAIKKVASSALDGFGTSCAFVPRRATVAH